MRRLACLVLLCAGAAAAEPTGPDEPGCEGDAELRKGVQKRDFLKRHRLELSAWGGFFAGDLLSTSYGYGGALGFFFTEDFGVEASLVVTPFDLAVERPLSDLFGGQRFHPSTAFVLVGDLVWSPVHLKLRASDHASPRGILHGDLLFLLGGGDTFNDTVQGVTFDAGLALKLYFARFLAVRFDLRDYLMAQEAVGTSRIVNNVVGLVGLSFFTPAWF